MNRWGRRHAGRLQHDLDDGETLLGANRVVLVSASSILTRGDAAGTPTGPTGTRRLSPRPVKLAGARRLGFPLPGWLFVLGVSDRRLLFWRATPMLGTPHSLAASMSLDEIAAVRGLRRLGATRLSIVLDDGAMVVVQALWSRQLDQLATAFDEARMP